MHVKLVRGPDRVHVHPPTYRRTNICLNRYDPLITISKVTLHKLGLTSGYYVIKMAAVITFTEKRKQFIKNVFIDRILQMRYQIDHKK
jgi:hypothetical protein